jgi:exopolysaccharide production protein ExoQ
MEGLAFAVGFFFSFRIFIGLISVRVFGTDNETGAEVGLILNILFLVAVTFTYPGVVRLSLKQMMKLGPVRWSFVFLGFSGCSLLWSSAASLGAAIAFWCGMAADISMVVIMLRAGERTDVSHSLIKGYVWGACAIAVIAWLMPGQSDLRLGDDELLGANTIGYACGFALLWAQYLVREKDGKWGAAALLLAITMLRCLSKTTIVAFLIGEAFLMVWDKSMSRKTKLWLTCSTVLVVAAFWNLLSSYYDVYTTTGEGNQAETLTGRLGIWAYVLIEGVQQPWIGHGFHSVWKVIPPFGDFEARHAHNELLQQFYAYGVVGICMFVGIYGSLWLQLRRLSASPRKTFFFAFLIFILVRGLADTEAFDLSLPIWCIVMISILLNDEKQRTDELEVDLQRATSLQTI